MKLKDVFSKENKRTFVIAEIGSNHNQDIKLAYELIDVAKEAGADAVKFQSIKGSELYNLEELSNEEKELMEKIKFNESWYDQITAYAKKKEIPFFSAPTYLKAIDILEKYDVEFYKIASPQTYGFPQLIEKVAKTKKPAIMSTGYCNYGEIERAVRKFQSTGNQGLALLHCVSQYPAPPESINLNFIQTLKKMFNVPVGFSDHTLGYHITLAAAAKGAEIIEKHITLSRNMKGPDHFFALEPNELRDMIKEIREVEISLGTAAKIKTTKIEDQIKNSFKHYITAKTDHDPGEVINKNNLIFKRMPMKDPKKAERLIESWDIEKYMNKKIKKTMQKNSFITKEDVEL